MPQDTLIKIHSKLRTYAAGVLDSERCGYRRELSTP